MTTIHPTSDNYPYSFADATEVPACIPDVSHWQGDIDANKFIAAGAHGVIIRAGSCNNTTGVCYTDYQLDDNIIKFEERLPIGFYWYYRPNHDPIKQADEFCYYIADFGIIPPVCDFECNPNNDNQEDVARWLYKFLLRLEANTGIRPLIYTRAEFWNRTVGDPEWAHEYELWIARYTSLPLPWGNPGDPSYLTPTSWQTWHLWQWSADGNGRGAEFGCESADIDLNRFNGSLSEFYRWCGWKQEPPPPDDPEEPCKCCDVLKKIYELAKRYI